MWAEALSLSAVDVVIAASTFQNEAALLERPTTKCISLNLPSTTSLLSFKSLQTRHGDID
jgi:hypothetical protein